MSNHRPGHSPWEQQMREQAADADATHTPDFQFHPHDGVNTDANMLGADLLAGPDPTHPDVAAQGPR